MAQLQSIGFTGSISYDSCTADLGKENLLIGECNAIYATGSGPECQISIGENVFPDTGFGIGSINITNAGSGYGTPSTNSPSYIYPKLYITSTDTGEAACITVNNFSNSVNSVGLCLAGFRFTGDPSNITISESHAVQCTTPAEYAVGSFVTSSRNIGVGFDIGQLVGGRAQCNVAIGSNLLINTGSLKAYYCSSTCCQHGGFADAICCNTVIGNSSMCFYGSFFPSACRVCRNHSFGNDNFNILSNSGSACCNMRIDMYCNVAIGDTNFCNFSCGYRNIGIGSSNFSNLSMTGSSAAIPNTNMGYHNVSIGHGNFTRSYNSSYNTFIGANSADLGFKNTAQFNLGLGFYTSRCLTTADNHIAIGRAAGCRSTSNNYMLAIGYFAGERTNPADGNANDQIFIGATAGRCHTYGDANTVVGHFAYCKGGGGACRNHMLGYAVGQCLCGPSTVYNVLMGHGTGISLRCESANNVYLGSFAGVDGGPYDGIKNNVFIGHYTGNRISGSNNIIIGCGQCCSSTTQMDCCLMGGVGSNNCLLKGCLASSGRTLGICGTLSKTAGSFQIAHPDPCKNQTHDLFHSFVESPTAGDNLYRFEVESVDMPFSIRS